MATDGPTPRRSGRILVIRGGALGDFVLTLPVLRALRLEFPDTHLEVLGYPRPASLAVAAEYADAVRALESRELAGFFARGGQLDASWGKYFSKFHVILSFLYDPDGIFHENVARVSRAQFIAGPYRPSNELAQHATEQLMVPLQRLAIFDADPVPRFPGEPGWEPPRHPAPVIAVHLGSGSESKNWPEPAWRLLLGRWMEQTPWQLVLVGGEAEADRVQRLADGLPAGRFEVWLNRPLWDLARGLAACTLYVGHDSGVSHLAAAAGARGLVLWGPTNEVVWRPRSERFVTVRHVGGLEHLPVEVVDAQVRALVG